MFCCISIIQAIPVPHDEPNWVADGASIMSRQAYLNFVTCGIVQLAAGIVDQMPKHFNMRFKVDALVHFTIDEEQINRSYEASPSATL